MLSFTGNGSDLGRVATDLSASLGGGSSSSSSGDLSSVLGGAATGATTGMAFGPYGAAIGGVLGGIGSLFGGHGKPDHERGDIQKVAAANNISEQQVSDVCGYKANHSSDNYDQICSDAAKDNSYFLAMMKEYNTANPNTPVVPGASAQQVAVQQQQLITTALNTDNFTESATGKQLLNSLLSLSSDTVVGTQGQTAGSVANALIANSAAPTQAQAATNGGGLLNQVLKGIGNGALKGGQDAVADSEVGQSMKKNYLKDWVKENQLLAAGIGAFGAFGLVELYKKIAGKGGKISL